MYFASYWKFHSDFRCFLFSCCFKLQEIWNWIKVLWLVLNRKVLTGNYKHVGIEKILQKNKEGCTSYHTLGDDTSRHKSLFNLAHCSLTHFVTTIIFIQPILILRKICHHRLFEHYSYPHGNSYFQHPENVN